MKLASASARAWGQLVLVSVRTLAASEGRWARETVHAKAKAKALESAPRKELGKGSASTWLALAWVKRSMALL
jgi:hypothetical protein